MTAMAVRADVPDPYNRAVGYAGRMLKGEKPAEMPMTPTG